MPHFITECTDNIREQADLPGLFAKVNEALAATGIFPIGGIRSRAHWLDTWQMADGRQDYAFVHMTLKIGAGRSLESRQDVGDMPVSYTHLDVYKRQVKLWREGKFKEFCTMLPEYADYCYGEGNMHDTVMLLGLLGWDKYDGKVEFITELFASSGTGQVNAVFPLPAQA